MPRLTVVAVRAALVHLAIGATFGALILWDKGMPLSPHLRGLLPTHRELLLVGWMIQLAMGVAYWILPRFSEGEPRGRPAIAWASVLALNFGLHLTAWHRFLGLPPESVAVGRLLELAAAVLFAAHAWPRVRAFGT